MKKMKCDYLKHLGFTTQTICMSNNSCTCFEPIWHEGKCTLCGGIDKTPITPTQLPAEVADCINNWIVTFALAYHKRKDKDIANDAAEYLSDELGMPNELTAYANKLHQAQQEIESLKRWKMEAAELLAQIHAYAHKNMEVTLGQCNVKAVIGRCKQFDQARILLETVLVLIPGTETIHDKIQTFLDGTK